MKYYKKVRYKHRDLRKRTICGEFNHNVGEIFAGGGILRNEITLQSLKITLVRF